jgi:hypothetical protein
MRQDKFDVSSPAKLVALALTIVRRKMARKWRQCRRQQRLSSPAAPKDDLHDALSTLRTKWKGSHAHAIESVKRAFGCTRPTAPPHHASLA